MEGPAKEPRAHESDGRRSERLPGWPRLLTIDQAAEYVGLSRYSLAEYVADGTLPVTRPIRPNTPRAYGYRDGKSRRTVASAQLRRALFDVRDLDALVDLWKRAGDR